MEIANGRKVRIRYQCRSMDGRVYTPADRNTLDFEAGAGEIPATLEGALMGATPGERRTVRLPASEVGSFPFAKEVKPAGKTSLKVAYDFGPGEGGDVTVIPADTRKYEPPPAGTDLDFEVEVLAVE